MFDIRIVIASTLTILLGLPPLGITDDVPQVDVEPIAFWSFDDGLPAAVTGKAKADVDGPRSPQYPAFSNDNHALALDAPAWITIADEDKFDFTNGDSITLEAWVKPTTLSENVYVVAKGRTESSGPKSSNQNWALRLRKLNGRSCVNFLFRSQGDDEHPADWHRWTSTAGISAGNRWHHIAVTYTFGDPKSVRGFLDGKQVEGKWDMGGETTRPPVVDDDEVRIGSAYGGHRNTSFDGSLDNVAIYRHTVPPEELQARFEWVPPEVKPPEIPQGRVAVQLFASADDMGTFPEYTDEPLTEWEQDELGFVRIPHKYDSWGIRNDWGETLLVRAWTEIDLKPGQYRFLARSRGLSRLTIDGQKVLTTPAQKGRGSAHNKVVELPDVPVPGMRPHWMNDNERVADFESKGGRHQLLYEIIVGGPRHRPEFGETCVAIAQADEMFQIVSEKSSFPLTDDGWFAFVDAQSRMFDDLDTANRVAAGSKMDDYWASRHAWSQETQATDSKARSIDYLIAERIRNDAGPDATPPADDYTFLRRVFVDVIGLPPTLEEAREFLSDASPGRRERLIDRLLNDPRRADNLVGYWQDTLAENPNLLKPTLNNTGPFRWWIREALADNKPIDRFATELILMRGSTWNGGTAGFSVASQNDVPMAAKAHVIGSAFLGVNLKCARCHDAPYHEWKQGDLFQLAAMLDRKPLKLPASSTVPSAFFEKQERKSLIDVTLKPGSTVSPHWPFGEFAPAVEDERLLDAGDTRERLAAQVTASRRFAEVIANRVWARLMGAGIVEPVDDWEGNEPSDPALLAQLADELILSNYNLREFTRVILSSDAYQRESTDRPPGGDRFFEGPYRRRMSAEQIVDGAFHAVGVKMKTEPLTLDVEGDRPPYQFLHFGYPKRAWEFTTLANERDRPSLALPRVQAVVDVLRAFGWRNSRPEPVAKREETPNLIQPGALANGTLGIWLTRLSDDSELTQLMLTDQSVEQLVDSLFLRLLTRKPSTTEQAKYVAVLNADYATRIVPKDEIGPPPTRRRFRYVSWSNHLNNDANSIKIEMEELARRAPHQLVTFDPSGGNVPKMSFGRS